MATNSSNLEPEETTEETHHGGELPLVKGCSRFSRSFVDSSFENYISDKEQRRSKGLGKIQSGRIGSSGPLKKISKKQKKRNADYKKAREEHYSKEENQKCFLCGTTNNLSIHHMAKRLDRIADASSFVTLCLMSNAMDIKYPESNHSHSGGCHSWAHANASLSKELGLII